MPKISIITVNFNGADGLRKTLDSVMSQVYDGVCPVEHIIIDGGSTDGSVELIKEYSNNNLSKYNIKWISEKDRGIYDGMNKGIQMASGEYLYFLNGGDVLCNNSVVNDIIPNLEDYDIVVGRVNYVKNGVKIGESELMTEADLSLYNMYLHGICHQAAIIKSKLMQQFKYDFDSKINADWKFFVQAIVLNNAIVKLIPSFIANFDKSGLSSNLQALLKERAILLETIVPQRIAIDYLSVAPYYYEVVRVKWLLKHSFFYRVYRAVTTCGIKLLGND